MRALRTAGLAAALSAGAVVVAAAPARAEALLPDCEVTFVSVKDGETDSCETFGPPPTANTTHGVYRTVTVAVANGAVTVTLACAGAGPNGSVTVTSTATFGGWGGGDTCTLTMVSIAHATSAVAWSHGGYAGSEPVH